MAEVDNAILQKIGDQREKEDIFEKCPEIPQVLDDVCVDVYWLIELQEPGSKDVGTWEAPKCACVEHGCPLIAKTPQRAKSCRRRSTRLFGQVGKRGQ